MTRPGSARSANDLKDTITGSFPAIESAAPNEEAGLCPDCCSRVRAVESGARGPRCWAGDQAKADEWWRRLGARAR